MAERMTCLMETAQAVACVVRRARGLRRVPECFVVEVYLEMPAYLFYLHKERIKYRMYEAQGMYQMVLKSWDRAGGVGDRSNLKQTPADRTVALPLERNHVKMKGT